MGKDRFWPNVLFFFLLLELCLRNRNVCRGFNLMICRTVLLFTVHPVPLALLYFSPHSFPNDVYEIGWQTVLSWWALALAPQP
jgi:hypothetical protein